MNSIIEQLSIFASQWPEDKAYIVYKEGKNDEYETESLTWKELDVFSNNLAQYLLSKYPENNPLPVVVFGHKSPFMLVCFFACIKSGRTYCPVDVSVPKSRLKDIVECVQPEIVLSTELLDLQVNTDCLTPDEIIKISNSEQPIIQPDKAIKSEDVYYIIFTSGSTGKPKGVQITLACLEKFISWGMTFQNGKLGSERYRFLNQAPFSFDLSVMDLYLSLYSGGTVCALTKDIQKNSKLLYNVLRESNIEVWVSTPSFADVCLIERSFSAETISKIKVFLFCGEILSNATVEKLHTRFPEAIVYNTYGPTESTVAVTETIVDNELLQQYSPLPVGKAKKGTWIYILDEHGNQLPDGVPGEVMIVGDTVSIGYFKNPEQTSKVFGTCMVDGKKYRSYRTGDRGYLIDGMLFYCGRIDFQIKLHGYRIEIEDIENNLVKVKGVEKAAVLPVWQNGQVKSLTAYVVFLDEIKDRFETVQEIKKELKVYLPEYMVPKKIQFMDALPMTSNGKVDRKLLGGLKA